jgi:hypothetical protein
MYAPILAARPRGTFLCGSGGHKKNYIYTVWIYFVKRYFRNTPFGGTTFLSTVMRADIGSWHR